MPEIRPVEAVTSKAAIVGHPIHPMIVPFPVALLVAALVTDITFMLTEDPFWARVAFWSIVGGVATGALAAVFGLIDFISVRRVRQTTAGWVHFIGNVMVVLLSIVNGLLRLGDPTEAVVPAGLTISAVVAAILVVTGWYGGELTYRHGVGVAGPVIRP